MEMQFKNEIKKLADVVVWADGLIRDGGYYEEKYKSDATTAYCNVKAHELWKIKTVVLEAMERHAVYTSALNKDIADKAAKIDLLEKEIEGRKAGYYALKENMDTKYMSINEHNDICKKYEDKVAKLEKENATRRDLAKMNRDTICNQYEVCEEFKNKITALEKELADCKVKIRHQKENLDGINKTLEIRTKENESLIKVKNNQQKEIEAHEAENARLSEKILSLKKELKAMTQSRDIWFDTAGRHGDTIRRDSEEIKKLKNEKANMEDNHGRKGFKEYIKYLVKEEERKFEESWKARLNEELAEIFEEEEEETVKYKPSEIDSFTYFLKDEVNKKRIVDIRHSVENYLHVTRDLLDTAVKLIVAKGYHEYEGVVTGYGKFHVLTTPDVEFKDLYDTWKIKSIGPDIPCGEDAIE